MTQNSFKVRELEESLKRSVDSKTPDYIKNNKLIDMTNNNEFVFRLKREHLEPYDAEKNPEGLDLKKWLVNYRKEAAVSTAGVRGPQNILYPWDTRFPINLVGIALATLAKALAAKEKYPDKKLVKIAAREVRYNSKDYMDLIARIQASQGISTLVTEGNSTIPIWLTSYLAFVLDLLGGEYITSSHGISVKNATKDLNSQGSQYLPEESMEFVRKIEEIFEKVQNEGYYDIKISASNNGNISSEYMKQIENGVALYVNYLKDGVANDESLNLIKKNKGKIVIDNVGGSAYKTLSKILEKLGLSDRYVWLNQEEDPFFHGIGKADCDPKGNKTFYDYSVDATVVSKDKNGNSFYPVIKTMGYEETLKDMPVNTVVFITDPDHDRLTVTQIEDVSAKARLQSLGIDYMPLNDNRILAIYTANQSFLLIMDFWYNQLKNCGKLENHPRFIIKTTASAKSWDEWAKHNRINVINVPVGFKEIANIMKKVEKQIKDNPNADVVITDLFGNDVNLGKNPRMIFGGEESGGMIIGAEEFIVSQNGRKAIAMREKSASEAIIAASALCGKLDEENIVLSEQFEKILNENNIISKFDIRTDISYYNESEPDIEKLKEDKLKGESLRTKNDLYYLSLALAYKERLITLDNVKEVFRNQFPELNFENLIDIKFVGDGTYLEFDDKFVEIRPSGTDAKTKAYAAGSCKQEIEKYTQTLGNYSGERNDLYNRYVSEDFYQTAKEKSMKYYIEYTNKDANNELFTPPEYNWMVQNICQ